MSKSKWQLIKSQIIVPVFNFCFWDEVKNSKLFFIELKENMIKSSEEKNFFQRACGLSGQDRYEDDESERERKGGRKGGQEGKGVIKGWI